VDMLAREHGVLVMPGVHFGAMGWVRISYGKLPSPETVSRIQVGLRALFMR
jgi:aspartate/methionine/tyrosine aminotransferase